MAKSVFPAEWLGSFLTTCFLVSENVSSAKPKLFFFLFFGSKLPDFHEVLLGKVVCAQAWISSQTHRGKIISQQVVTNG